LLRRTNPFLPLGGSAFAAALFFLGVPRRRRWHGWSLLVLLGTMIAGACIGCGNSGSVSNNPPSNPGTTAGNYNVTVTATSGTVTSSVSIPLTVQ
jgi:cyanate permease